MSYHTGVRLLPCNSCGLGFGLESPMSSLSGGKKHHCNHCGKLFYGWDHLARLVTNHTGEKQFLLGVVVRSTLLCFPYVKFFQMWFPTGGETYLGGPWCKVCSVKDYIWNGTYDLSMERNLLTFAIYCAFPPAIECLLLCHITLVNTNLVITPKSSPSKRLPKISYY